MRPSTVKQFLTTTAGRREGVTYHETSGYLEAPVTPNDSLVVSPWLVQDASKAWRAEATIAAKHVLTHTGHTVTAVQAGAL